MAFPVVGLDIGKAQFYAAFLHRLEDKPKVQAFANSPEGYHSLLEWLEGNSITQAQVCLEATSTYGHGVAGYLHALGFHVSIVNPLRIKGFAESRLTRTKNDVADAGMIARYCALHNPPPWRPPTPEEDKFRQKGRQWQAWSELIAQERNRLETATDPDVIAAIKAHIVYLQDAQKQLLKTLDVQLSALPELKADVDLLVSIPGIGPQTALLLIAELGDVRAFGSARQLAAFAGLTPQEHSSGTSVHGQTRLCKIGSPRLRALLYMPALSSLRWNPAIQAMAKRLEASGKAKMQIVGAAMHKLIRLVFGVVHSGLPFDPSKHLPQST